MPELPPSFDPAAIPALDAHAPGTPMWRIGQGWDRHRLVRLGGDDQASPAGQGAPGPAGSQPVRSLRQGGVSLAGPFGVVAHSDGDALLHAITDALLAACGAPDLGALFPDNDPANAGTDSAVFLKAAAAVLRHRGWEIGNVDATVLLQSPRILPYRTDILARIASILEIPASAVSLKGKTGEGVDAVGESRAVEAMAVAMVLRGKRPTGRKTT